MVPGCGSSFTVNRQFFALLSTDGRLRVWDSSSGKLIQEFSPTLKAESSCTCLCWTRGSRGGKYKEPKRKRRKASSPQNDGEQYPLLALGTACGNILTFDIVAGELGKSLVDGHSSIINDIKFVADKDIIYSCSKDRYIVEWSLDKCLVRSKWKADKISVNRIAVGPSGNTLLSAGQSIKLWDLETKVLLQRFHGHLSSVTLLQFSPFRLSLNKIIEKKNDLDDGYYFLSASLEDKIINAWQVNSSQKDKTAVASYRLSDVPVFMDSLLIENDDKPLKLCAGCCDGRIHFFESTMNGKTTRAIEATKIVDVVQKEKGKSNTTPVPFLNAVLFEENDVALMIVHGTTLKPGFKKFVYSKLEVTSKIIQELAENILLTDTVGDSDTSEGTELANQNTKVKMIGNTSVVLPHLASLKPCVTLDVNGNEQDQCKTETNMVITLGEKLRGTWPEQDNALKLKPSTSTPSAGSFSQMLIQALHSSDDALINEILFKYYPENVLQNTIKRIPNNLIGHLLMIIVDKLQRNPARSKDLSSWLRIMMAVHLTYFLTNEALHHIMVRLFNLLTAQRDAHPLLLNLQGKIELLYTHANSIKTVSGDDDEVNSTAVIFNDVDSEDGAEEVFGKSFESEDEGNQKDSGFEHEEIDDEEKKSNIEDEEERTEQIDSDLAEGESENDSDQY